MNATEQNGFRETAVVDESSEQASAGTRPSTNPPYLPGRDKRKPSLKDSGRLLVIGGGIALVLLLLAFRGISNRSPSALKSSIANAKQQQTQSQNGARAPASMTPIIDTGHSSEQETNGNLVHPYQIGRTANQRGTQGAPTNLGSVRPFDNTQSWQPASTPVDDNVAASEERDTKGERDSMDKASLVFARNNPFSANAKSQPVAPAIDWGIGLAPGTRLRSRLESAVNTAVPTPVVAVIEYNYEQSGEIVVPAGARAFGHLEAADRSGYVGIRFDSLMMPDGSAANVEATATDLQLRPLRGNTEGKHAGKNILVRSFAGVGEVAATLVGRGSLNQPLSEGDLLRERLSSNIGQASDQAVTNLAVTEHVVISIPAGTEIYVVLQKPAKEIIQTPHAQPTQTTAQPSIEELRQLMQLQRELNQTTATKPSPE